MRLPRCAVANKFLAFVLCILVAVGACAKPAFADGADLTLANVQPSVYKVKVFDLDGEYAGSGTAWKFADESFMTAGHVCDGAGSLRLVNEFGQEYPVVEFDGVHTDEIDFCFLHAPNVPGAPLKMTLDFPQKYETVYWVGATLSIYDEDDGATPGGPGTYVGGEVCIVPGTGEGASGAPIFTKNGVFGILTRHATRAEIAKFQSLEEIYWFLVF